MSTVQDSKMEETVAPITQRPAKSPKSFSKDDIDIATQALNHFVQGKPHLLQEACGLLLANHYGEIASESADAFYWHNRAPLRMALENRVLGNALDGGSDAENLQIEDPENMTGSSQNINLDNSLRGSCKQICSVLDKPISEIHAATRLACAQPNPQVDVVDSNILIAPKCVQRFSQPANLEKLLLSTLLDRGTQTFHGSATPLHRIAKWMTSIQVKTSLIDTVTHLEGQFTKLNYSFKSFSNIFTVTTVDSRGDQLVFKAEIIDMGQHILVLFGLSKGCGLEFKKNFLKIKDGLSHIIIK